MDLTVTEHVSVFAPGCGVISSSHSALVSISAAEVCVESSVEAAVSATSDAEITLECCFAVGETMSGHEQQRREAVPLQDHRVTSHQLPGI